NVVTAASFEEDLQKETPSFALPPRKVPRGKYAKNIGITAANTDVVEGANEPADPNVVVVKDVKVVEEPKELELTVTVPHETTTHVSGKVAKETSSSSASPLAVLAAGLMVSLLITL